MATLETTYLGIPVKSPLLVASSTIANVLARIKAAEDAGAGALVFRSLFEEQVRRQAILSADEETEIANKIADARAYFSGNEKTVVRAHLLWMEKVRAAVSLPLIGSINAILPGSWEPFAKAMESTGINALELNFYSVETTRSSVEIEQTLYDIVEEVVQAVKIPVAVKLSPFFTGLVNVVTELEKRGAAGVVLFNRFLQPDIHLDNMTLYNHMELSNAFEMQMPLRWTAILYGRVKPDIAFSTGIHTGQDALKAILTGAQVVQVASTLLKNGVQHIQTMNEKMSDWLDEHHFESVDALRGKLSRQNVTDTGVFDRAQYVEIMMSQH